MKNLVIFFSIFLSGGSFAHEMQHGFILSDNDRFAEHLVANGHHSHELSISGELQIESGIEQKFYAGRKRVNMEERRSYFLFQAQNIDLPSTKAGQVLTGHIVESKLGDYEPNNVIVKNATFTVKEVHVNVPNPFFAE